jgi:hypothetical protein
MNMSKKTNQTINRETLAKSAEGYPLLGNCVYWSANEMKMPLEAFIAILKEVGIDEDYADKVRHKSALLRAIQKETDNRTNSFHRNILEDKDYTVFVIVAQSVDVANRAVDFKTDTQIIFDKKTGMIKVDGYNKDAIIEGYEREKGVYNTDNFRKVVLDYVKGDCEGISVRDNGGIYFIPSSKMDQFQKLQALFAKFDGFYLGTLPIIDTAQAKKSMWNSLVNEVKGALEAQKAELDKTPPTTERGVESHLRRFKKLKGKVEMYEDLFVQTAQSLKEELESLSGSIKKHLS